MSAAHAFAAINPANGKRLRSYRGHTSAQVEQALARAHAAFLGWRELAVGQRCRHLRALGRHLRSCRTPWAELAAAEMGKPLAQGYAEVEKCALLCEYYARHAPTFLADERPPGAPAQAWVAFAPLGVVLAIMPWNFPFWQVFRAAVPALAAGNTVLLKHAPNVPGCALAIAEAFREAGLPPGLLQTLLIGTPPVPRLIADPRVAAVTLTGSTGAGRHVAALAGRAMKPGVFELGGSDAYLILEDADLDHAAEVCAQARLTNSGQSCVCAKRFIAVTSVAADFAARLLARLQARRVGDPRVPGTDVGPLARADLRATLQRQVDKSRRLGARVVLGGRPLPGAGFFYPPTLLAGVRPGMPAFDEELFGPVAALIGAADEAEAIQLANRTPYGLGAAVFTRRRGRGREVADQLEAGSVFINEAVRSDPALPFGGIKGSGYGRELGAYGLRAFVNVKTLWSA